MSNTLTLIISWKYPNNSNNLNNSLLFLSGYVSTCCLFVSPLLRPHTMKYIFSLDLPKKKKKEIPGVSYHERENYHVYYVATYQ